MPTRKRETYFDRFSRDNPHASPEFIEAARAVDRNFSPEVLDAVLEWIANGWEYDGLPSPPLIAAAMLQEAETAKADIRDGGDTNQEWVDRLIFRAMAILRPLNGQK